jgi:O-antigen ligase
MSSVPSTAPKPARWGGFDGDSARWIPSIPRGAIVAAALLLGIVAGRFLGDGRASIGVALIFAVCYGPVAFLDVTVALAVYVAILFVQDAAALSIGPNTIGVLVFVGWIGTVVSRSARPVVLREQPRLLQLLLLFALWLTFSVVWASNAGDAANGLETWLIAILAFVVTVTTLRAPRDVTIICVAFIVGAVISVIFGIASGGLAAAAANAANEATETTTSGRFTGGGGDPNVQAAGFIVAMFLCAGLWSIVRRELSRWALGLAFVIITIGFFATQSRGGLLALGTTAVAGIIVLPRQRKRLLGLAGAASIGLGVIAIVNPAAIARMTDIGGGSSGRNDLWKVAWKIFNNNHWIGIGLSNFQAVEPSYVLRSGELTRVDLVAETPHLVHNLYLQLLTETGVIGFVLFLAVAIGSIRACWMAAHRFDLNGRVDYGDVARAALMAMIAMLAAQFFISDGDDWRLWILLAFGPVLLSLARRSSPDASPATAQAMPDGRSLRAPRRARSRLR